MEHTWSSSWTRDGLDLKTRSIVTLSILIALRAYSEFKRHVRSLLNNGVSTEEIRELIIHSSVYCGYPAALSAINVANVLVSEYAD